MSTRRTTSSKSGSTASKKDDLLSKEEEFKRLNAELEKKTHNIVYEAEQVLKAHERNEVDSEYLSRLIDQYPAETQPNDVPRPPLRIENQTQQPIKFRVDEDLRKLIQNASKDGDDLDFDGRKSDELGIVPKVANEMSSDAQIRFLKAKLKVMQEELERCGSEITKRDEENVKLAQRCKELEEERVKQLRISNSHQTQMEKFRKQNEELNQKLTQSELQASALRKENDTMKKDLKKSQLEQGQLEVKLNRQVEEIDKLKVELSKQLLGKKDTSEQEKSKIEHLTAENKRLQKQKQELIQAFRKQMKLIDVLKRQKMHLEAAKVLQFAEQEFLSALEWQNASPMDSLRHASSGSKMPSKVNSAGSSRPPSAPKTHSKNAGSLKVRSNSDRQLSSREDSTINNTHLHELNGDEGENHYANGDIIDDYDDLNDAASEFASRR